RLTAESRPDISTSSAVFGYQLLWSVALGTACIALLVEMSGRLSAVSRHTVADAIRERFGAVAFAVPLVVLCLVSLLVLAAELGGVAVAVEMATSVRFPVWVVPCALVAWLVIWRGSFGLIENGVAILGLVTLVFAIGAWKVRPDWHAAAHGLLPTLPS